MMMNPYMGSRPTSSMKKGWLYRTFEDVQIQKMSLVNGQRDESCGSNDDDSDDDDPLMMMTSNDDDVQRLCPVVVMIVSKEYLPC